jgi:hypothetical protein
MTLGDRDFVEERTEAWEDLEKIEKKETCVFCDEGERCRVTRACRVCEGKGFNRATVMPFVQDCIHCEGYRLDREWARRHGIGPNHPVLQKNREKSRKACEDFIEELRDEEDIPKSRLENFKKSSKIFPDHEWTEEDLEKLDQERRKTMAVMLSFPSILIGIGWGVKDGSILTGMGTAVVIWIVMIGVIEIAEWKEGRKEHQP